MTMSRGAFDDIPLTTLFPRLPAADVDSLKHAARTVDAARVDGDKMQWEWALDHAVFPEPVTDVCGLRRAMRTLFA
ncbi:hypothetical protein [Streptomyces sp. H34-S4]|uniref:hypothetical protein n=1 Tax=Streptomyces sp. H34-S4 TaxID=2996463 RepID=UPI002271F538|nr:hypothetical protein [Streptomyces sp. H34-S4]MCY0936298.1 hypothetical protein [Streptomyces sp. H34-S4]